MSKMAGKMYSCMETYRFSKQRRSRVTEIVVHHPVVNNDFNLLSIHREPDLLFHECIFYDIRLWTMHSSRMNRGWKNDVRQILSKLLVPKVPTSIP
jgi:hypothetical protein